MNAKTLAGVPTDELVREVLRRHEGGLVALQHNLRTDVRRVLTWKGGRDMARTLAKAAVWEVDRREAQLAATPPPQFATGPCVQILDPERADRWRAAIGSDFVPVVDFSVDRRPGGTVYRVDVDRLSALQAGAMFAMGVQAAAAEHGAPAELSRLEAGFEVLTTGALVLAGNTREVLA